MHAHYVVSELRTRVRIGVRPRGRVRVRVIYYLCSPSSTLQNRMLADTRTHRPSTQPTHNARRSLGTRRKTQPNRTAAAAANMPYRRYTAHGTPHERWPTAASASAHPQEHRDSRLSHCLSHYRSPQPQNMQDPRIRRTLSIASGTCTCTCFMHVLRMNQCFQNQRNDSSREQARTATAIESASPA